MTQPDESTSRQRAQLLEQLADTRAWWQELCSSHQEWEDSVVRALRAMGATWRDVGEAFRTSRQAAWERFGHLETEEID